MDLSILAEIDSSIILGIIVSTIVMSLAVFYDKYRENNSTDSNTSISNSFEMLGQLIDFSRFKVSNPFAGSGQKIKRLITSDSSSKDTETSELEVDTESNYSAIKNNLRSNISYIKLSLSGKGDQKNESIFADMDSSENAASTERSNLNFDVDEILRNKKSELDFDDNLINEMATAGGLGSQTGVEEPDSDLSHNNDLSIDIDEFEFGFGEGGDGPDNEFAFEMSGDETYDDDFTNVVAVDDFSFDDDDDNFIESLKNDIIIDEKEKIDFMSELKGESLDIEEIKTELGEVLETIKRYNTR
ncbi:hypothetical protein [Methanococcoides sp. AM1]|uniref:hypothetical protein n=1 Tax=Methanococcoides sp. AM1 TaxID=1201011 RepID=UPI0010840DFE|nr:hypothetical protein [Methanococcoides sp. AM1]